MNTGKLKDLVEAQLNSDVAGAFSISRFNAVLEASTYTFFKQEVGVENVPNNGPFWQKSQQVTDALSPLLVVAGELGLPLLKTGANGYADLPSDYWMLSDLSVIRFTDDSCTMKLDEYNIDVLTDEQFQARIKSVRKQPTAKLPIATFRTGKLKIAPNGIQYLKMSYLKKPAMPYYDFVIQNDLEVYLPPGELHDGSNLPAGTPSASVEIPFGDKSHIEFYAHVLSAMSDLVKNQYGLRRGEKLKDAGT